MKVLVTGGTGFLGRHLVWRLADLGHDVCFTGRDAEKARQVTKDASRPTTFAVLSHAAPGSLAALTRAMAGADAVIHCAALSSPWGRLRDFYSANVQSTEQVLSAMRTHRVARLVHISTPSIYFQFCDRIGIREDEPLPPPVNYYAQTKREAERLVRAAPVSAIILRPRGIFGMWDETLLPRLLRLLRRKRFPLFNGGNALIDLTYVDNVVDAIVLALALQDPIESTFNISNGQPLRAGDLFAQLARAYDLPWHPRHMPLSTGLVLARACEVAGRIVRGWEPPLTRYTVGTVAYSQTLDLQRARDHLGYVPRVDIHEGIRRTSAWMQARAGEQTC
jgi:nucleoside-diphosphate-sugar epimerase